MYLAKYKSQSYPLPYRYRRGLGCACQSPDPAGFLAATSIIQRRALGDIWTSVDNAVATAVDWASIPWNVISGGQLTQAQKLALIVQGQDQIQAVTDSPGARVSPTVAAIAQAAAAQNMADLQARQTAAQNLPGPSNSQIDLSLLGTAVGAQPGGSFFSNYGPLLLAGGGVALALWLLKS
jgi:hypothetical protein